MTTTLKQHRAKGLPHPEFSNQYTDDQFEFIQAVARFKKENNRPFPTATDYLWIARQLGYRKPEPAVDSTLPSVDDSEIPPMPPCSPPAVDGWFDEFADMEPIELPDIDF